MTEQKIGSWPHDRNSPLVIYQATRFLRFLRCVPAMWRGWDGGDFLPSPNSCTWFALPRISYDLFTRTNSQNLRSTICFSYLLSFPNLNHLGEKPLIKKTCLLYFGCSVGVPWSHHHVEGSTKSWRINCHATQTYRCIFPQKSTAGK